MPRPGQAIHARVKLGKQAADCWLFLGNTTPDGHGKVTFCGQNLMAHRWLWEQLFGPIKPGLVVYNTCTTKGCINPHHLACGHQADACRNSVQTKLVASDVAEIRAAKGIHPAALVAPRHGISVQTVRDIWAGRAWARARKHRPPNTLNPSSERNTA